ncbi:hypothetical protein EYZ11_002132 [Aspergillus tanneri]|uniref:Uncharacterized protein n=1 Tax=Aspergillus tanneri TaxID=1220188 RepID=A0A4S3JRJ1_9EURO|nr:hypothetical protein EYZ11_002132 [Aspergillus tanneri]
MVNHIAASRVLTLDWRTARRLTTGKELVALRFGSLGIG